MTRVALRFKNVPIYSFPNYRSADEELGINFRIGLQKDLLTIVETFIQTLSFTLDQMAILSVFLAWPFAC